MRVMKVREPGMQSRCEEVRNGSILFGAARVSSITYYTQDSARSELGTSLLQRLHRGFRPGDDRRGTALWQVAEIEHHGGQASPRGIREVFA